MTPAFPTQVGADTKARILSAVRSLIAHGETEFSMSRVAEVAEMSKSSLYYFFKNKKDLCTAVIFSVFDGVEKEVEKILSTDRSGEEKILSILTMNIHCSKTDGAVTAFIFQKLFEKDFEIQGRIFERRNKLKNILRMLIEQGVKEGSFRKTDAILSSELLAGFLDLMALTAIFPCPEKNPCLSAEILCSHFLSLLRPSE